MLAWPRGRWAHPRSRGENIAEQGWDAYALGSSPLTRGKRGCCGHALASLGLIPAHAGKTYSAHASLKPRPAHPRSRGENKLWWPSPTALAGSSPLTRGKRDGEHFGLPFGRLIPAHAGKTRVGRGCRVGVGAHPRSRGENPMIHIMSTGEYGSSPLTRGKRVRRGRSACCRGLIPAHAGKTENPPLDSANPQAHPRSRGENGFLLRPQEH